MEFNLEELVTLSGIVSIEKINCFGDQKKFDELHEITKKIGIKIKKAIEEENKLNETK